VLFSNRYPDHAQVNAQRLAASAKPEGTGHREPPGSAGHHPVERQLWVSHGKTTTHSSATAARAADTRPVLSSARRCHPG